MPLMKLVFTFLLFVLVTSTNGQLINIKTSIYFDTDSFTLTTEHYPKLDKFADTAQKLNIKGLLLRGNTDADADSLYNIRLSAKRSNSVKKYLLQKGIIDTLIHIDYYGENKPIADNASDKGKQKNRRVDIILSALLPIVSTEIVLQDTMPLTEPIELNDTCSGDTTFTLPYGSIVTMNKCEFIEQMGCGGFAITEFVTPQVVRDSGLNTMDTRQNILISGGMFTIKICNGKCLKKPLTLRVLIKEGCEPPCTMGLWEQAEGWKPLSNSTVKVVKEENKRYYEIQLLCGGGFNFDCAYNLQSLTIKVPKKYKILEAKVANDCPLWVYESKKSSSIKRSKVKICIICQKTTELKENYIYLKALTPNGDTVVINYQKIKSLQLRYKIFPGHKCRGVKQKNPCPNIFYFFGRRKSKVKIRKKDFDLLAITY